MLKSVVRFLGWISLTFFSILVGLKIVGEWLAPDFREAPIEYSEQALNMLEEYRGLEDSVGEEYSIVVNVDHDADEEEWRPKGESPLLAELVAAGQIDSVDLRVGKEPLVLSGVDGVGKYGGTLVTAGKSPVIIDQATNGTFNYAGLVRWSPMGYPIQPHVARGWEANENFTEWTFYLREGMRWSDGHPFTADDVLYWWRNEVLYFGGDLPDCMVSGGQPGRIEKVDAYTFRIVFPKSKALLLEQLTNMTTFYAPRHYLGRYHPEIGEKESIEAAMNEMKAASARSAYMLLKRPENPAHPRLWPWVFYEKPVNAPFFLVRNPYFWGVDEQGNQLPYIDRIMIQLKSAEVIAQAAVTGQLDFQLEEIYPQDYSLLMANREEGGYQVHHWPDPANVKWTVMPNLNRFVNPDRPVTQQKASLLSDGRFRKALSLSIDREMIIELGFQGWGEPAQGAPRSDSPFAYPKLEKAYVEYDPARANALLDELGLVMRDAEGFRTFPDGSRMTWFLEYPQSRAGVLPLLLEEHWREVGVNVIARERAPALFSMLFRSLDFDFLIWRMPAMPAPIGNLSYFAPVSNYTYWASGYGQWYDAGGYYAEEGTPVASGIRPPDGHPLWEAYAAVEALEKSDEISYRRRYLHEIYDIAAENLWNIGISTAPPFLAVVSNDLRNVPRRMVRLNRSPHNGGSETFYFENPRLAPGVRERIVAGIADPMDGKGDDGEQSDWSAWAVGIVKIGAIALAVFGVALLAAKHPYVARRLSYMVPTLLVISILVFMTIQLPPGSFLEVQLMQAELEGNPDALARIEELKKLFPFEDPIWKQYLDWMGFSWFFTFDGSDRGLLQGYLGRSMETLDPVNDLIGERFLFTFLVSLGTIIFTWAMALPIGVYTAVRQYSPGDYLASVVGFVGMSFPNFLLAILLMYLAKSWFGINVSGLFSPEYAAQPFWDWGKVVDLLKHIWLPVVVIGTGGTAGMIRVMRANLLDELKKPYVTTARAKGVKPLRLLLKYPVRLALNPFISGIGGIFPALISGGAIVGMVLSLPTMGPLQLSAIMTEDFYLAGSLLMLLSLLAVIGTLVSDLLLLWLDPRIRMEGGGR